MVWFSLWVREAPGSNPGWAQLIIFILTSSTFVLNHISTNLTSFCVKKLGSTEIWTRIAGFKVQSANHYTIEPTTRMGFEPTRAEPNGLAVHRLNHSATSSWQNATIALKNIALSHFLLYQWYQIIYHDIKWYKDTQQIKTCTLWQWRKLGMGGRGSGTLF